VVKTIAASEFRPSDQTRERHAPADSDYGDGGRSSLRGHASPVAGCADGHRSGAPAPARSSGERAASAERVFHQDLTRTVQVDAAGHITYPLIGQVAAAARTARDLEATIAAKLGERYLQSPQVMVLVKAAPGQKFTVEGAVASPGIYDINGRMTLLQAIATAKGLETAANPRNVVVFRLIEGRRMAGLADLSEIRSGKLNDPQIYAGDVIVVESSRTKALLRTMLGTVPLFNLLLL
jgi:protein involved in polysaccharide export with SLBB domain